MNIRDVFFINVNFMIYAYTYIAYVYQLTCIRILLYIVNLDRFHCILIDGFPTHTSVKIGHLYLLILIACTIHQIVDYFVKSSPNISNVTS